MGAWIGDAGMSLSILITGAGSGFGLFAAEALANLGHTVFAADINTANIPQNSELRLVPIEMDVTDEAAVKSTVQSIAEQAGRIDVCINNAGFAMYDLVETPDLDRARRQFDVNFWGTVLVTRAVLPIMRENGAGRFVHTSSLVGRISGPMMGWYSASKFALEAFTDALRCEIAPFGFKASLIEPGSHSTGFGPVVAQHLTTVAAVEYYKPLFDGFVSGYIPRQENAPGPEAVVNAIVEAATSPSPKTRYVVGDDAKAALELRSKISDEDFDKIQLQQLGIEL